jgi:hypothetical protein
MPDESASHLGPEALPEDAAHRLLARAVELDARRASNVSIAQLRDIALEAGIAPAAFDDALAEIRGLSATGVGPADPGLLRRTWRRWQGLEPTASAPAQPTSLWTALTTNAVAFATFYVMLGAVSRLSRPLDLGWPAHSALMIAVNLFGVAVALRLRARVTALVLGVTAAAQLAGYVMHLVFGIKTVQGGPTQSALMLAALLGIAFGAVMMTRWGKPPAHAMSEGVAERERAPGESPAPEQPPPTSLRLRTA